MFYKSHRGPQGSLRFARGSPMAVAISDSLKPAEDGQLQGLPLRLRQLMDGLVKKGQPIVNQSDFLRLGQPGRGQRPSPPELFSASAGRGFTASRFSLVGFWHRRHAGGGLGFSRRRHRSFSRAAIVTLRAGAWRVPAQGAKPIHGGLARRNHQPCHHASTLLAQARALTPEPHKDILENFLRPFARGKNMRRSAHRHAGRTGHKARRAPPRPAAPPARANLRMVVRYSFNFPEGQCHRLAALCLSCEEIYCRYCGRMARSLKTGVRATTHLL